ncbi:MAG TPA: rhodanese-like domain-containing protein [Gammaproteobacteria bacterium]|nr:rhodanese-like domain-containing protein [Gammaproteobacteria bacterium]
MATVSANQLKQLLSDGGELALLDVREQGPFSKEHLLFACCVPLSRLELLIDDLVPHRATRTVLMDGGAEDGQLARRAAARLSELGYTDVRVLDGGLEAWRDSGFEVFSGVNVPSKAFGEIVEQTCHTPHITPQALKERIDRSESVVILDARPLDEYQRMNIPGGIDTPGAELVYRVRDLVPDAKTPIVVNCAGRTRSIIGTQSLINAGLPNPVAALKGGTMGWRLAGLELEHGQERIAPPPSAKALAWAQAAAHRVGERAGVVRIDANQLDAWRAEAGERSLFIFDVRGPDEFEAGHLPDARHAAGGQLVQATDEYVGVRNARLVLVDDTEVRATMTASWLFQLGWPEVAILAGGIGELAQVHGPRTSRVPGLEPVTTITPEALASLRRDNSVTVVDLSTSVEHAAAHIPGAWWGVRARLREALPVLPPSSHLVLTSGDGVLAQLAAPEVQALQPDLRVEVLAGGNRAWFDAGMASEAGMLRPTTEQDDVWYKPYEHPEAEASSMQGYLTWEVDLVPQIAKDGDARFEPLEV